MPARRRSPNRSPTGAARWRSRRKRALLTAVGALLAATVVMPAAGDDGSGSCRHVGIVDAASGRTVRGIEDIAVDRRLAVLYLSADDRWAVEDAAAAEAATLPQGGIYRLDLGGLHTAPRALTALDLTTSFKAEHDFHPQGIDLVEGPGNERRLVVVNKRHLRTGSDGSAVWRLTPTIEVFALTTGRALHLDTVGDPALCRANDVVGLGPDSFLVSNDGEACDRWGRWREYLLGAQDGNVIAIDRRPHERAGWLFRRIVDGIGFANGLALGEGARTLYVAASRESEIRVFLLRGSGYQRRAVPLRVLALEGGPDNLSWTNDRRRTLLTAAFPSLWRAGFYRNRWLGVASAPSRVIVLDVDGGRQSVIFDDPDGALVSAASVAVRLGSRLVIGSAVGEGLVVCERS